VADIGICELVERVPEFRGSRDVAKEELWAKLEAGWTTTRMRTAGRPPSPQRAG
jgi:hypothetical protein